MPNQYIVDYLKQNKDKFSIRVLKKKLLEAKYPEKEIEEAIKIVQRPIKKVPKPEKVSTNFWDFKHKKNYTSKKEKLLDFIAGFLFVIILIILKYLFRMIFSLGELHFYGFRSFVNLLYLIALIYFFVKKRGYISWGIILGSLLPYFLSFPFYF